MLLAVLSGSTDAIAFLALGGAFTSVMTGNLVLLGVGASTGDGELALSVGGAVLAFCLGAALGTVLAGTHQDDDPVWPRRVTLALAVEAVLYIGYAVGWWLTGAAPQKGVALVLLLVTAVALGVQSSTVQRFGVSGLSSTYLTGTLTTIVIRLTSRRGVRDVLPSAQVVAGLVAGAAAGAALITWAPLAAPALQVGLLAVVLGTAVLGTRQRT